MPPVNALTLKLSSAFKLIVLWRYRLCSLVITRIFSEQEWGFRTRRVGKKTATWNENGTGGRDSRLGNSSNPFILQMSPQAQSPRGTCLKTQSIGIRNFLKEKKKSLGSYQVQPGVARPLRKYLWCPTPLFNLLILLSQRFAQSRPLQMVPWILHPSFTSFFLNQDKPLLSSLSGPPFWNQLLQLKNKPVNKCPPLQLGRAANGF